MRHDNEDRAYRLRDDRGRLLQTQLHTSGTKRLSSSHATLSAPKCNGPAERRAKGPPDYEGNLDDYLQSFGMPIPSDGRHLKALI
jgi:hypothetical protein